MTDLSKDIREIKDRTRRMETRITRWLETQGFDTQTAKPVWEEGGIVRCPGRAISLNDIMNVVPPGYGSEEFDVFVKEDYLLTIFIDR